MICLYDLVDDLPRLVQDFVFAERVAKTKSLLHAEQILPLNRANQHDWLHSSFAALFVKTYDLGGDFELRDTPLAVQYMKQHNNNPDEAKRALQRDIESKGGKIGGIIEFGYMPSDG